MKQRPSELWFCWVFGSEIYWGVIFGTVRTENWCCDHHPDAYFYRQHFYIPCYFRRWTKPRHALPVPQDRLDFQAGCSDRSSFYSTNLKQRAILCFYFCFEMTLCWSLDLTRFQNKTNQFPYWPFDAKGLWGNWKQTKCDKLWPFAKLDFFHIKINFLYFSRNVVIVFG